MQSLHMRQCDGKHPLRGMRRTTHFVRSTAVFTDTRTLTITGSPSFCASEVFRCRSWKRLPCPFAISISICSSISISICSSICSSSAKAASLSRSLDRFRNRSIATYDIERFRWFRKYDHSTAKYPARVRDTATGICAMSSMSRGCNALFGDGHPYVFSTSRSEDEG